MHLLKTYATTATCFKFINFIKIIKINFVKMT